jgi:hypothetical protein
LKKASRRRFCGFRATSLNEYSTAYENSSSQIGAGKEFFNGLRCLWAPRVEFRLTTGRLPLPPGSIERPRQDPPRGRLDIGGGGECHLEMLAVAFSKGRRPALLPLTKKQVIRGRDNGGKSWSAVATPDALYPIIAHMPACFPQQRRDLSVAVTAILTGHANDCPFPC